MVLCHYHINNKWCQYMKKVIYAYKNRGLSCKRTVWKIGLSQAPKFQCIGFTLLNLAVKIICLCNASY